MLGDYIASKKNFTSSAYFAQAGWFYEGVEGKCDSVENVCVDLKKKEKQGIKVWRQIKEDVNILFQQSQTPFICISKYLAEWW